jgi:hypothetical protein
MSKSHSSVTPVIVAVMLGAAIAFACVPLYGITSAIPAPAEYFQWARGNGQGALALLGCKRWGHASDGVRSFKVI